jgi:hypothetical protein
MKAECEKWLARVLLLNGALTVAVVLGLLGPPHDTGALPWLVAAAVLACVSALLSLRGHRAGLMGGALYYAVQVPGWYPFASGWSFSVKAGINIAAVVHLASGVLVVNGVALALLAATLWMLRYRRPATN